MNELLACLLKDSISNQDNIDQLKMKIYQYTQDVKFKGCKNMGEILKNALDFLVNNYENVNPLDM